MVNQGSLQSDVYLKFKELQFVPDRYDFPNQAVGSIIPNHDLELVVETKVNTCAGLVKVNLETLKCFEVVERQFAELGIVFGNCIAIEPSNPAFPCDSGQLVLIGAPKGGFLQANFLRPVSEVNAFVTSSQKLVMSAYNHEQRLVNQRVLPGANLANSDSAILPNTKLSVRAKEIHSITMCVFDGQFTIDELSFCYC